MHIPKDTNHTLNNLLRGELAATQTYQQALAELDEGSWTMSWYNRVRSG